MRKLVQFFAFYLLAFFITTTHSQKVECIRSIDSPLGVPENCTSAHSATRPINVSAKVTAMKNSTWAGDADWIAQLIRDDKSFINLE